MAQAEVFNMTQKPEHTINKEHIKHHEQTRVLAQ